MGGFNRPHKGDGMHRAQKKEHVTALLLLLLMLLRSSDLQVCLLRLEPIPYGTLD